MPEEKTADVSQDSEIKKELVISKPGNPDSTAVNVIEHQEGPVQVHMAEEYHSLEEFRGYSEEGMRREIYSVTGQ